MKQTIFLIVITTGFLAGLIYLGGAALAIGLGAISLTAVIFGAFALGSWWTAKVMAAGAKIAITSAGQNDAHDAMKIKALAGLTQEAIKAKNLPPANYPILPFNTVDGTFTIAGLDDTEVQQ